VSPSVSNTPRTIRREETDRGAERFLQSQALPRDLRGRALAAIAWRDVGRQASWRLGVSAASASRWNANKTARNWVRAGDGRSKRIAAHAEEVLAPVTKPGMRPWRLRAALADQGFEFGYGAPRPFFEWCGITLKRKRQRMRASKSAAMSD
jgi:transposase